MSEPIRLIAGLGNPGPDYERTRHNAGFWLLDQIADDLRVSFTNEKSFFGHVAKARFEGEAILLVKPMTYMNRSGQSVGALARFYKLAPEQILVAHDELDLLPGQAKLKQGGSHAGHNGLKDIQAALGSQAFWRLRLGIGHPRSLGLAQQVVDFVLHPPRKEEQALIDETLDRGRAIIPAVLKGEFEQAMKQLHSGNA
ncbi:aminoacyl-tRNA hydrolase [Pigmentiphaga sp.]|uniref:aminoacyl-tRNA hydrolase n=1 Tax=Pigmentiphaga sp. TaxID=1977564 RepID=UPI00128BE289|nr:aminoacyl-tRNA hydrolase [Pigmentiphaga sp.]MPS27615.1 aminoacyl-tRNA hydrolase [Alcaligenaceae bacterium SAGV5]MPS50642.1 aminoacyl-tRNA hydrolase [Alcaligenaceae bacterium SAGV3]MPT56081.1 aminoacyl-tRNA hydrolase [Alcaligenaceae bacterium]